jgi:hypothetical protein
MYTGSKFLLKILYIVSGMQCGQTNKMTVLLSAATFLYAQWLPNFKVPASPQYATGLLTTCAVHKNAYRTCKPRILRQRFTVIGLANCECAYTITFVINMTTDRNDMYLVFCGSVSSVRLSITHYWLIAIHKTHSIRRHLHEIADRGYRTTKQKLLFHDSKLLLSRSIMYPRSVAPHKTPSSAKCIVHFYVTRNVRKIHKTM